MMVLAGMALMACNEGGQDGDDTTSVADPVVAEAAKVDMRPGGGPKGQPGFVKLFTEADKDGDGKVNEAEVRAAAETKFRAADKSGDGYLDDQEREEMFKAHWAARAGDVNAGDSKATPRMMGGRGRGPGGMGPMARMDADGDGKVSAAEFVDGHVTLFKRVDEAGSGAVSLDEIGTRGRGMPGFGRGGPGKGGPGGPKMNVDKRFAELDKDGDGKVTKTEAEAGHKARFEQIDGNKDGVVDAAEIAAHQAANKAGAGRKSPRMLRMDADGDGKVTVAEFGAQHAGWFERMDGNGDGVVSLEEMRAHRPMRGRGPQR
jgi:Ca2+-binding EF-hand superfamily protein